MDTIKRLISDERGLESVEYAVITGLIVTGVVLVISNIGTWVKEQFDDLYTNLTT